MKGFLSLALVFATVPALVQAREGELRVERISVEDGLSHSFVYSIHQDSRGFIWLGTADGLNRYDGYRFEVYRHDPEDPHSISPGDVAVIREDRRGDLWIGLDGGGLDRFRWEDESFVHHRHDPADPRSLSGDRVLTILDDHCGRLWVGTASGLNLFDRSDGSSTRYRPAPAGGYIRALVEDGEGGLWVGTNEGLFAFDPDRGTFTAFPIEGVADPRITVLGRDAAGNLWVGSWSALYRFDPRAGTFEGFPEDPESPGSVPGGWIRSLWIDRSDTVWVGAQPGGLYRLDRGADEFVRYRHQAWDPQSLNDNSVTALFADRTGNLWIGTLAGASRLSSGESRFRVYRERPGSEPSLSSDRIWPVLEGRRGELWIGTYDAGLNRLGPDRSSVTRYRARPGGPGSLPSDAISALYEDRSGQLWVGTMDGLCRWERASGRCSAADAGLRDRRISCLHEDRAGRFWIGTAAGLHLLGRDETSSVPRLNEPFLETGAIHSVAEDDSGVLWIAVDQGGVFSLAPDLGETVRYQHERSNPASLSGNAVTDLLVDRAGLVWIGTFRDGLNRLDPRTGEVRRYGERDGLASNTVLGLLEDDAGRLWLATNRGLVRFDPAAKTFLTFGVSDGLPTIVFSPPRSSFASPRGEMFFGTFRGLLAFDPGEIVADPYPPQVVLTDFQLFNKSVPLRRDDPASPLEASIFVTKEIHLSHRDYVFAIEFAGLHFANPRRHRYAYRLEGFDADWIATNASHRLAHYSNLDPGTYVFRVRASNGDGVWSEEGASLRIVVHPAPWASWWAFSLYALAAFAVVLLYVRSQRVKIARERRVNEQLRDADRVKDELLSSRDRLIVELEGRNDELMRFTYTVSHDLKSPLVTIQGFAGAIAKDLGRNRTDRLAEDLGRIREAAEKMRHLLDDLLELSRIGRLLHPPEEVALADLVREALDLVAGPIAARGVEVDVRPGLPVLYGDRVRLLEVVQNLVENAVKFMGEVPAPRIEIGAERREQETACYVRDNGVGIEERFHGKVFGLFERLEDDTEGTGIGLALARRIIEFHGGRIWVESAGTGQGSTFYFTLPRAESSGSLTKTGPAGLE